MAFIVPRSPLKPQRSLWAGVDARCKVVRAADLQAFRKAEEIIAVANEQADLIVSQAQAAYEAERERGYEEGKAQARLEQAEQMIENVARNVDYFGKVELRMVDLVVQAVQKIIGDFNDRERVMITVRNVLSVVRNQKQLTLRLNTQQVDIVKASMDELLAAYPGVGYIDVLADNRVKLDACILESEIGIVEASIDSQVEALRIAFLKVLGSRV